MKISTDLRPARTKWQLINSHVTQRSDSLERDAAACNIRIDHQQLVV